MSRLSGECRGADAQGVDQPSPGRHAARHAEADWIISRRERVDHRRARSGPLAHAQFPKASSSGSSVKRSGVLSSSAGALRMVVVIAVRTIVVLLAMLTGRSLVWRGGLPSFTTRRGSATFRPTPERCKNCHVMNDQYASWSRGHHVAAGCADCHLPHEFIPKYLAKNQQWLLAFEGLHPHGLP